MFSVGSRIFLGWGRQLPKSYYFAIFAENCMKMKEFGPGGASLVPSPAIGSANGNVIKPNVGLESKSRILRSKIIMLLHECC